MKSPGASTTRQAYSAKSSAASHPSDAHQNSSDIRHATRLGGWELDPTILLIVIGPYSFLITYPSLLPSLTHTPLPSLQDGRTELLCRVGDMERYCGKQHPSVAADHFPPCPEINLSELQKSLDSTALELVENQKENMVGRKKLADQTRGAFSLSM